MKTKCRHPQVTIRLWGASTRSRCGYGTTLFIDLVFKAILNVIPWRVAVVALYALHLRNIAGPPACLHSRIIPYVNAHAPGDLIVSLLLDSLPVSISAKKLMDALLPTLLAGLVRGG